MNAKKALSLMICLLLAVSCFAQMPKGKPSPRGKAELKAGDGSITIDYGRPSLSGPAINPMRRRPRSIRCCVAHAAP